jgi:hypothetical protein
MQLYLFGNVAGAPVGDGADDAALVYHEYAHGLSGRLVTYADGWDAMWWTNPDESGPQGGQSGALGEGTSDWYALDHLVAQGLEPDTPAPGEVKLSENLDAETDLIRFDAIDCPVAVVTSRCAGTPTAGAGGFTFADLGRIYVEPQVHADGEIWAQTLWDLRAALVGAHGADGITRARRYVTQGLRLAPPEPTFLDMRDAILAAAGGDAADADRLWGVFAARGMGWSARTTGPGDAAPFAAGDLPPRVRTGAATAGQTTASLSGTVDARGSATTYRFEYGVPGSAPRSTAPRSISGSPSAPVAETIAGLAPGTTYQVQLVAQRGARARTGGIVTFTTTGVTPPPPPPPPPPAAERSAIATGPRAKANRRGYFTIKVRFADDAQSGTARITVTRKGRTIARKGLPVIAGQTKMARLRLTRAGRKAIAPGRSRKVTVRVQLPSTVPALKRTVTLKRAG